MKHTRHFNATITAGLILASFALTTSGAASASSISDTLDTLENVTEQGSGSTAVLDNIAEVEMSNVGVNVVDDIVNDVEVVIPKSAKSPIRIGSAEITLPISAESLGETLRPGVVEFGGTTVDTAVITKDDGSVQITTVIADSASPESFSYGIELPPDATWSEMENGALLAADATGALITGVAPAWAMDAKGQSVPTRYVLDGARLTQIVDHRDGAFTYPIVADPWLGAAIFKQTEWHPSGPKAVAILSDWGTAIQTGSGFGIGGWAAGQAILKGAGWDELRSKVPAVNNKATYRQQYDCHVLGAYTPLTGGPSWDLEGNRSNNPNWLNNVANHKCNW
jgi:hypothetical protein